MKIVKVTVKVRKTTKKEKLDFLVGSLVVVSIILLIKYLN
ncbi:hypothetical protein LFT63_02610 [Staphylococcus sp. FSL H8-0121]